MLWLVWFCSGFAASIQAQTAPALERAPQRIVSLQPALTEVLCAFEQCQRLVGIDRYSSWPAEALAHLPKVGGRPGSEPGGHHRPATRCGAAVACHPGGGAFAGFGCAHGGAGCAKPGRGAAHDRHHCRFGAPACSAGRNCGSSCKQGWMAWHSACHRRLLAPACMLKWGKGRMPLGPVLIWVKF